jgi:hypothetical protein
MAHARAPFIAQCACGKTELAGDGAPLSRIACYCDDCQAAGKSIDAMTPGGHSGLGADGGTVSALFRKDRVRCLRGEEGLVAHKLRPESKTCRMLASCCNSNMLTRFERAFPPMVALRTYSELAPLRPELCIGTKFAPDPSKLAHDVPRHPGVAPSLVLKLLAASVQLALRRIPLDEGRLY